MKNEETIKKYLENARERIESAEILKEKENYNDAVSRAYYAFFDAATAALLTKDVFVKTHHGLILLFEKHFIKTGAVQADVGRWLGRAQEAREEADYEVYKKFTKEEVETAIAAAKKFVAEVEKLI